MTAAVIDDEVWMARYPVGAVVRYWPGVREGVGIASRTRSLPWVLGGHTPVVMVEGHAGGVALTHVEPCEGLGLLTALHELAVAADNRTAQELTRQAVDASFAAHDELDKACEAYRRQHHPRAGRVIAVFGEVFTISPAGRKVTCIYSERTDR